MVKALENRSQGNWLKKLRQFSLERKKAKGAGQERLPCGRNNPLSLCNPENPARTKGWVESNRSIRLRMVPTND